MVAYAIGRLQVRNTEWREEYRAGTGPLVEKYGGTYIVRGGDMVRFDINTRRLDVELSDDQIRDRMRDWSPPPARYASGVMAKYARLVSSASKGAVTG